MAKPGIISKNYWDEFFRDATITGCAVRDRNIIYLSARPNVDPLKASLSFDEEIATHMCIVILDRPEDANFLGWKVNNMNKPQLGVSLIPAAAGLLVSRGLTGKVVVMGKGADRIETIDPDGAPQTIRVKNILGYAYSVGSMRHLYRRLSHGKWERVGQFPEGGDVFDVGFRDMDAFSEADMYAVGGQGDVWHYDGICWQQISFPSQLALATVTCAGDGNVYVTGEGGSIWVGRDSTWNLIYSSRSMVLWNDTVWFDGRLWLSSDYEFGVWNGDTVSVPRNADGSEILMSGHLDARDGLLAIASPTRVLTFDGSEWRVIVDSYS